MVSKQSVMVGPSSSFGRALSTSESNESSVHNVGEDGDRDRETIVYKRLVLPSRLPTYAGIRV